LGLADEVLDDEVLVALAGGARGRVGEGDEDFAVDDQMGVLAALGGTGPFVIGVRGLGQWRPQGAGPDRGPGREALEAGDLVLELGDLLVLLVEDVEQEQPERAALGFGDVRHRQRHTSFYAPARLAQLPAHELLR
jgi:hypothetical protein